MVRNWQSRQLVILVLLGGLLEPVGHRIAYLLRYGPRQAAQVQAIGSHAYFPRLASFTAVTLSLVLASALLIGLGVRLMLGRRLPAMDGFGRTFLVLAAVQGSLFVVQETLEAIAIQATPDFQVIALLTVAAQLPVAAAAALVISRLHGLLLLTPEAVRIILALRLPRPPRPIRLRPAAVMAPPLVARIRRHHRRRGPPLPF